MSDSDDPVGPLRDALAQSPDNVPLRKHLAQTLRGLGRHAEAEKELRDALALAPGDEGLKLNLAACFFEQRKTSEALVLVEDLIRSSRQPARAYLLHTRILLDGGHVEHAVREYRKALDEDPDVEDAGLSARLGVTRDAGDDDEGEVHDGRMRISFGGEERTFDDLEIERPDLKFADVGGMDKVKEEVRMKIIHPLSHPEIYEAYGQKIGGGILLYGPPGCGKTHLARATAGEVSARFLAVGIHDVLEMWVGQSERNLHQIFEHARESAPCVLFFDEVDALGASRTDMRHSAGRQTINQFLSELDGAKTRNDGLLVLGATNAPWHLDTAFRRPGRFDRIIFVPPPDRAARAAILEILLKGKPQRDVDFDQVAKKTDGFSGADLKAVVEMAVEGKLRDAMKTGVPEPLVTKDLAKSAKVVNPSTKEWFATARNYALYSNSGGFYDDILQYLDL